MTLKSKRIGCRSHGLVMRLMSDAHATNLAGLDFREDFSEFWNQRQQVFKFVAASNEYDHRYLETRYLLLVAQMLVGCNQDFKLSGCGCKERAILVRSPSHFRNGSNFVPGKLLSKPAGDTFIEQNPHARVPIPWRAPGPRSRARGSPWGSLPGNDRACPLLRGSRGEFAPEPACP